MLYIIKITNLISFFKGALSALYYDEVSACYPWHRRNLQRLSATLLCYIAYIIFKKLLGSFPAIQFTIRVSEVMVNHLLPFVEIV